MNIYADDVQNSSIFPREHFERKNSVLFLKLVKRGNIDKVKEMLNEDPF